MTLSSQLIIKGKGEEISRISFSSKPNRKGKKTNTFCDQIGKELAEYLKGNRRKFSKIPLPKGTPFQRAVWKACGKIPYGETRTYADIAKMIDKPKAVRAVGTALGKNPVCIIVPCHRVVPSSGGVGQYAGGAKIKEALLRLEGCEF